ncbi:aromatic ring-hydroxylating dioxygenase subunit alpha [Sphingobium chlorophenolicum]|uniref:Putative iron-sulfur protein n=1 Tax=Sphingobium chlorophenolicum TaxID=46429 RepID=A0A081RF88_SPHCR|nr:aromatic ring-hydroxylating dioxygenase subunit alpha [Sphingobium chlorophenolicum]KEQ53861.1 putative iron-sulfur protein [Sphingobium chlorophenolicum]
MTYVRNAWYVAGWTEDIPAGKPKGMMILDQPVVIWRNEAGAVHALEDRCVHRLAPLSLGRCEGANLRCMYHGFLFDAGGRVVGIPGQEEIPSIARVRSYPVAEQDSWVWVWMGDPARADEGLIPRVNGIDDPGWALRHGTLDYAAEARLINDNLTDFSHLSFVHADSFGANEDFANTQAKVAMIDRGVRIERWVVDQPPVGMPDSPVHFDFYLVYDYFVPGILCLTVKALPLGTIERIGHVEPPEGIELMHLYSAQAVTPTTSRTTRYFFSNGLRAPADPAQVDFVWDITLKAFAEDNEMIEGQQRIIDLDPDRRIMPAAGDKGTILYNRLVDRLVREEQKTGKAA